MSAWEPCYHLSEDVQIATHNPVILSMDLTATSTNSSSISSISPKRKWAKLRHQYAARTHSQGQRPPHCIYPNLLHRQPNKLSQKALSYGYNCPQPRTDDLFNPKKYTESNTTLQECTFSHTTSEGSITQYNPMAQQAVKILNYFPNCLTDTTSILPNVILNRYLHQRPEMNPSPYDIEVRKANFLTIRTYGRFKFFEKSRTPCLPTLFMLKEIIIVRGLWIIWLQQGIHICWDLCNLAFIYHTHAFSHKTLPYKPASPALHA